VSNAAPEGFFNSLLGPRWDPVHAQTIITAAMRSRSWLSKRVYQRPVFYGLLLLPTSACNKRNTSSHAVLPENGAFLLNGPPPRLSRLKP
jgi:hypothetical protein